jgi:hypothetical protein
MKPAVQDSSTAEDKVTLRSATASNWLGLTLLLRFWDNYPLSRLNYASLVFRCGDRWIREPYVETGMMEPSKMHLNAGHNPIHHYM